METFRIEITKSTDSFLKGYEVILGNITTADSKNQDFYLHGYVGIDKHNEKYNMVSMNGEFFFEELATPDVRRVALGYSTIADILDDIEETYPEFPRHLQKYYH